MYKTDQLTVWNMYSKKTYFSINQMSSSGLWLPGFIWTIIIAETSPIKSGILNFEFVQCIFDITIAFEINIAAKKLKGFLHLQYNPRISSVKHFITRCQLNRLLNDDIDDCWIFSSKITAIFENDANNFQKVITIFTEKQLNFDSGDENKILPILRNTNNWHGKQFRENSWTIPRF